MSPVAALTGGNGFLGRHVALELAQRGWRLRMLARRMPDLPELTPYPIELIPGDLSDEAALSRLVSGADAIFHMAGLVKAPDRASFMKANAEGTAALARAWRQGAPEARFLLISSMAAREPHLSSYAASKRAGEDHLREIAGDGDWRILRPGAIYGAHDEESLKVLKLANMPVQIMLNGPEARITMIDVRDAAEAICSLASHPGGGALHELTDEQRRGYSWPEMTGIAAAVLGHKPRPIRLPAALLRTVAAIGGRLAHLTGSAEMLTPEKVREILHPDWSARPPAPEPEIWCPRIGLEAGLTDMAAWARQAGKI